MKWFKHFCDGSKDQVINCIYDRYGHLGVSCYTLLTEICAQRFKGNPEEALCFHQRELTSKLRVTSTKLQALLNHFQELDEITFKKEEKNFQIKMPKLLNSQDEYVRKVRSRSRLRPDQLELEQNKNKEKEQQTNIDIFIPENLKYYGFKMEGILQMANQGIQTLSQLQQSLDSFSMDIEFLINEKKVISPLRYFMSIVSKGLVYASRRVVKNDEENALEDYIALKKFELDKVQKQEQELLEIEFQLWLNSLDEEAKKDSKYYSSSYSYMGKFHLSAMKDYFKNNIFVKEAIREKFVNSKNNLENKIWEINSNSLNIKGI